MLLGHFATLLIPTNFVGIAKFPQKQHANTLLAKKQKNRYTIAMDLKAWLQEVEKWAGNWVTMAVTYFAQNYGLDPELAPKVAMLYLALYAAKLNPRVTSGWRDPKKQDALRAAWDRGERTGLAVRPAQTSQHSTTSLSGHPASRAIDIQSDNPKLAADIAQAIGLRAGYYFKVQDPVHFDLG